MNDRLEQVTADLEHDLGVIRLLDNMTEQRLTDIEKYANRLHGAILRASAS